MKRQVPIIVTFVSAFSVAVNTIWRLTPSQALEPPMLPFHGVADSVVVEKSAHRLSLFKDGQVVRTYRIAIGRGGLAPKSQRGDALTPEGRYFINGHNPHSCCHLAVHISYPNATDVEEARARGVKAGGDIMIHGLTWRRRWMGRHHSVTDWTGGCIAVVNNEIEEIYHAVPDGTPIVIKQ